MWPRGTFVCSLRRQRSSFNWIPASRCLSHTLPVLSPTSSSSSSRTTTTTTTTRKITPAAVEVVDLSPSGVCTDLSHIPIGYGPCTHAFKVKDPKAFDEAVFRTIDRLRATAAHQQQDPMDGGSEKMKQLSSPSSSSAARVRWLRYGVLGLLVVYFVTVVELIFVVFDWNLIEPTTFFIGQFVLLWGIWHHYRFFGSVPFSWNGVIQQWTRQKPIRKLWR